MDEIYFSNYETGESSLTDAMLRDQFEQLMSEIRKPDFTKIAVEREADFDSDDVCPGCGFRVIITDAICPSCGCDISNTEVPVKATDRQRGAFISIAGDGEADKMLMATELLSERIKNIARGIRKHDPTECKVPRADFGMRSCVDISRVGDVITRNVHAHDEACPNCERGDMQTFELAANDSKANRTAMAIELLSERIEDITQKQDENNKKANFAAKVEAVNDYIYGDFIDRAVDYIETSHLIQSNDLLSARIDEIMRERAERGGVDAADNTIKILRVNFDE